MSVALISPCRAHLVLNVELNTHLQTHALMPARFVALQRRRRSSHLALGAAVLCAGWALFLEGMQLALPGRYVDVSDVVTAALAGVLGGFTWAWFAQLSDDALACHRTNIILMVSDSPSELRFKK